jgi:predicted glycoside hydrolase/deacetylase ChbG (UPF0249 family)
MRIILNADDFGWDADTVDATIECFERGYLTSATIMPTMPGTQRAVDYAKSRPQFSFGVHLTYICDTTEHPVSDAKDVAALCDPLTGRFLPSQRVRLLAMRNRIPLEQIERETAAQIRFLQDAGVNISHVDSHGHLHKFAPFLEALRKVLPRFRIRRVRTAQDIYLRKPLKSPTYWYGGVWRRRIMHHFTTTQHMFMPTSPADARDMSELLIPKLNGESIEVGLHPGYHEIFRQAECIAAGEFAASARAAGHELITWNDLDPTKWH